MILLSVVAADIESADLRMPAILEDVTSAGACVPKGGTRAATAAARVEYFHPEKRGR